MATHYTPAANGTLARAEAAIAPRAYPFIRAWCSYMGCFPYYLKEELRRATRENAPPDAIYCNQDGSWATLGDVQSPSLREHLERLAERWA